MESEFGFSGEGCEGDIDLEIMFEWISESPLDSGEIVDPRLLSELKTSKGKAQARRWNVFWIVRKV